jgi:hypothetical protein
VDRHNIDLGMSVPEVDDMVGTSLRGMSGGRSRDQAGGAWKSWSVFRFGLSRELNLSTTTIMIRSLIS